MREHNETLVEEHACWSCEQINNPHCGNHRPRVILTHFKKDGVWYTGPGKYLYKILQFVDVDDAVDLSGGMNSPSPKRINNLTELLAFLKKQGISDEQLKEEFPSVQVQRMRGRVLRKLVKGKM